MASHSNQSLAPGSLLHGKVYSYRIIKILGQGAFGITYLASTRMKGPLGEVTVQVALKEFFAKELDSRMADGSVTARTEEGIAYKYARAFRRESENLSKMQHPGIVNVLEAFEAKGTYYYSMEYLTGGSLDDRVKGKGIPESEALPLITKIGEALSYMHDRKVMHLDLKPKNIMLKDDGEPVIIDFGLSKQYDESGEPESSSTIGLGTPGYAPIEQANQSSGRSFQPTLDIYALGATLYKMLTGSTPPVASAILEDGMPESELKAKGVSAKTISAIRASMRPSRKDRPQSVAAFLDLLHGTEEEEETVKVVAPPPAPNPAPASQPAPEPSPKKPKTWLWALLAGVVVAGVATAIILGGKKGPVQVPVPPADSLATVQETPAEESVVTPSTPAAPAEPIAPGSVKITSTPTGAAIWLDGKNTKLVTPDILEDLTPGKHTVKLVLDGYKDYSGSVTVTSGKRAELTRTLAVKEQPAQTASQKPAKGTINGHEWVDLGLSVKWATCNVGASSPSDYGSYFAWGETRPKSEYEWENYKFRESGVTNENVTFSKYNIRSERGTVDNKKRLDMSDDAARVNWGGSWRMPTDNEWTELLTKCTWTWTTQSGKNGYKVTSKTNGNSIFLPAAGYRNVTYLGNVGSTGYYWSSSLNSGYSQFACIVYFYSVRYYRSDNHRYNGFSVRPVSE